MSEEIKNKIESITKSIEKINDKKSKIIFCIPDVQSPNASTYEIYFHATVLKNLGYEVIVLTERNDYVVPIWIEKELTDHKHVPMSETSRIVVGPEDVMVIPDVYSNIMEQTKNLPCVRVGFLQSMDYMVNSLIPGTSWAAFGIREVITTSYALKEHFETFYGSNLYNVSVYNIGIPDYFSKSEEPQKPIISIVGRNSNDISKIVKLFYSKYPQYSWVTFDPMLTQSKPPQQMRRVDFAKRLQGNFAGVWIDKISSFGTFPLECMKSGVVPICLKPEIVPEYLLVRDENNKVVDVDSTAGVWTNNIYEIPILIGEMITMFLDDEISDEIYKKMDSVVDRYSLEKSEDSIVKIYEKLISDRNIELNNIINKLKENLE